MSIRGRTTKVSISLICTVSLSGRCPVVHLVLSVLTWISIYWFSRPGPGASTRLYFEAHKQKVWDNLKHTKVPMGVSFFPKELAVLRKS